MKTIAFIFLLLSATIAHAQSTFPFYSVQILKMSDDNGRPKTTRINIGTTGKITKANGGKAQLKDLTAFTQSINQLITDPKVVKVPGDDDDRRTGIQSPHNKQNIYVTVIMIDDYNTDKDLRNKTCYRYRETNLGLEEKEYAFYRYFSEEEIRVLRMALE